jgi:hypothetical protein
MMALIPRLVIWSAGAVGTVVFARVMRREYQRVNDELDAIRLQPATAKAQSDSQDRRTLRRDPQTGVYRAHDAV